MDYLSLDYLKKKSDLGFNRKVLEYPERIIQFGTGVLLKGLPDFIIDQANKKGIFQGKIVAIEPTKSLDSMESFVAQDCLYTILIKGIYNKRLVNRQEICASIGRVLFAKKQWAEIIELSRKESIDYVFSNTTEIGLSYKSEKITPGQCPQSFPGQVVAILKSRFEYFNGDLSKGLIFLPLESIPNNGKKLKEIVFQLAEENYKDLAFLAWLKSANTFCNTAIDRIVPGKTDNTSEQKLSYTDNNIITVEPYAKWAIEGDDSIKKKLPFCHAEFGAAVIPRIENHKISELNTVHAFSSGLAFLSEYELVKDAMRNDDFYTFIKSILAEEVSSKITSDIDKNEVIDNLLERLRNPFLEHKWLSICKNYSLKMSLRCIPLMKSYTSKKRDIPKSILLGFAAGLAFLKPSSEIDGKYYGKFGDKKYLINDPFAKFFYDVWASVDSEPEKIKKILANKDLWGENLNNLKNFTEDIYNTFSTFEEKGIDKTLSETIS